MALIKCVDCGKEVSDRAKVCPNCGCPIECSVTEITDKKDNLVSADETQNLEVNTVNGVEELSNNDISSQSNYDAFPQHNETEPNYKKILLIIGGVLLAIVIIILIIVFSTNNGSGNRNPYDSGSYDDGLYDDGSYDDGSYDDGSYDDGSYDDGSYDDGSYDDYTQSIEYISDRTVDYDETNEYHRVFFGLKDANKNYMSGNNGIATIKIENSANEIVFSKDIAFTSSDFTTWTNKFWDSSRLLACIYIKDSELTKGSSDEGKLSISVEVDGASFDSTTIAIYDLPTKDITIKLPSTPKSFSDYDYSDNLEATIRVDKITYSSDVYDYDDVTVTFSFQTTMTYNSTPGTSKYVHIGYKLKNSSGIIVDSGTIGVSQSDTGDVSLTEKIFFDLSMKETYTLELSNSTN